MRQSGETQDSLRPLADDRTGASPETISLMDGLVQDATRALFGAYGVVVVLDGSPVAKTLEDVQIISMIGFYSEALSGSLLLALPNALVEHTSTAAGGLSDWSGELANQLLGRLKNQLLNYQVAVSSSLPVVVSGGELTPPPRAPQLTRYLGFVSQWGRLFVRMEMELCPTLELIRSPGDAGVDEGELLLF